MRRKHLLAWLALLGLCPGLALAQQPESSTGAAAEETAKPKEEVAAPAKTESEWVSLKDTTDVAIAAQPYAPPPPVGCSECFGLGCPSCAPGLAPCGDFCGDMGCDPCGVQSFSTIRRWANPGLWGMWMDVDYLLWNLSGYNTPPLVTVGANATFPVLGNAGVAPAFNEVDEDIRSGGRIRFGDWIDDTQSIGLEGHFFALAEEQNTTTFAQTGAGLSLGRPFIDVGPGNPQGIPSAIVIARSTGATPATVEFEGSVNILTSSNVYSAGGLVRQFVAEDTGVRVDALAGYRFFRLDEGLGIVGTSIAGPANPQGFVPGTTITQTDIFDTENEFHGGEFGMILEQDYGELLSVEVIGKVAVGRVQQTVNLEGVSSITLPPGAPAVFPGGLLVQQTNTNNPLARGVFEREEFTVLPEVNIKAGLQITGQVRATAGWTVMYMDNVVRPGAQIDPFVNPTQFQGQPVVGQARPAFNLNDEDVWLYGVNFGIEATY